MARDWRYTDTEPTEYLLIGRDPGNGASCPCLTIVAHPDGSRLGERATLVEGRPGTALSRLSPLFFQDVGQVGRSLETVFVSRQTTMLTLSAEGDVVITSPLPRGFLRVGGKEVSQRASIWGQDLKAGQLVELGENVALLLHMARSPRPSMESYGIAGSSDALLEVRRTIAAVSGRSAPVLITGETGVGKELVARAIHRVGDRYDKPFVAVNVASLPDSTAAAELFGHTEGAFTGAHREREGLFAQAHQGTLLLDEIGAASLEIQAMLLRTIEEGMVWPLGASRPRCVDARVIAATDENLAAAVTVGRFRASLLHRLSGYRIRVPPLRERIEDIPVLLRRFLEEELTGAGDPGSANERCRGKDAHGQLLPVRAMSALLAHDWPGNARELRNLARQATTSGWLTARSIDTMLVASSLVGGTSDAIFDATDELRLKDALRTNHWKLRATAQQLGVPRTTLYRWLQRCSDFRRAKDVPEDELRAAFQEYAGDVDAMAERLQVSGRGIKLRLRHLGLAGS